jgi:hypothetical protein
MHHGDASRAVAARERLAHQISCPLDQCPSHDLLPVAPDRLIDLDPAAIGS